MGIFCLFNFTQKLYTHIKMFLLIDLQRRLVMGQIVQGKIYRKLGEKIDILTQKSPCNETSLSFLNSNKGKALVRNSWLGVLLLLWFALATSCSGGTVDVDPTAPGTQIPDDFLGISVEWSSVPDYLGDSTGGVRPTVVTLLRAFEAEDHRVSVRIGGNSEDLAWWNPLGETPPPGVTINIGPTHLSTLAALAEVLNTRLILGLNLALDDPVIAASLVNAVYGAIPREVVQAFEMGNEPDLYVADSHHRGLGYGWNAYLADMEAFRDGIAARVPPETPFAAPALANQSWLLNMGNFCTREKDNLALVTTHVYPYTNCYNLAPGPGALLTEYATSAIRAIYKPVAAAVHEAGMAYRMAEMSSVSCGGADGVSNVYAAALWCADIAFQLASAGLDGLNFHTPAYYAVFTLDPSGAPVVKPPYYGMRFFSLATAQHGRLLPVVVKTPVRVHAWATLGDDGAVRVAMINLDKARDAAISLRAPGRSEAATLVRLRAPALNSRDGLTLGGQTWDGSVDGQPLGTATSEPVTYDTGAYKVPLPALEAVVVTLAPAM
jgi:hypothetical protein